MKKFLILVVLLWVLPLLAQSNTGELRLTVTDPSGSGVKSDVTLFSGANQYNQTLVSDTAGVLDIERLPLGPYQLTVKSKGFAEYSQPVEINSALPENLTIKLTVAPVKTEVTVSSAVSTLVNPSQTDSSQEIGEERVEDRVASLPGRSLQELVGDEPGWLFEGNDVLHPRDSEYNTQIVIDGIPLTDNRAPGFSPDLPIEDVEHAKVYTAGFPAQYGRRLGGVIALDTLGPNEPGLHGKIELYGGSYDTASAYTELHDTWKGNTLGVFGYGATTDFFLNPVVTENYHNDGTTGGWGGSFERDLTPKDRITMTVRHGFSRFQGNNEIVQQVGGSIPTVSNPGVPCAPDENDANCVFIPGGQLQDGSNFETIGTAIYQHIFSDDAIGWLRGMVREKERDYSSNTLSWPIADNQNNYFYQYYLNGALAVHRHRQDWQFGFESDNAILHENFSYSIPDCTSSFDTTTPNCPLNPNTVAIYGPGTPLSYTFRDSRWDLEQAAYVQDTIRLGKWTVDAGLRWDHYQLVDNDNAVSPRAAVSYYLPTVGVLLHASYDRVFETPNFDNILISSLADVSSLNPGSVRVPVKPTQGNFYEVGATKGFGQHLRADVNYYIRQEKNFQDDDTLLGTVVAFPINFAHDYVYGAEAKITVPQWWHFSGWVSYSYMLGNVWFPATGGLLLEPPGAYPTSGHIPISQDDRNYARSRIRYQVIPRLWVAFGADFSSGLPFEPVLTESQNAAIYGQNVVDQLNFDRGRILPEWLLNASVGADLYKHKGCAVHAQFDVANLNNRVNVLDFGGLFSANAIGPARAFYARLSTTF